MDCPADSQTASALLQEIAHCPVVADWYARPDRRQDNPCAAIIAYQAREFGAVERSAYQLPEPWRGDLERVPLLFVSSNPSIGPTGPDEYPRWDWAAEGIEAHFVNSFVDGIIDGAYINAGGGRRGPYVAFWGGILERARELFGPDVSPGTDYALTEVVHCKSRQEIGVHGRRGALLPCTRRYLRRVVSLSGAKVIVVLGGAARSAVTQELTELGMLGMRPEWGSVLGPVPIGERERTVVFLPHPNAYRRRSFAACVSPENLEHLRFLLANRQ